MKDGDPAGLVRGEALHSPVVLVTSPHAGHGNGDAAASAADLLRRAGVSVAEHVLVSALDHNLPQGARWRDGGIRAVVAAGGDGTLGAVATQLTGSGLPMGILPMGTSNDAARSLNVPLNLTEAANVVAHGTATDVEAGQVMPAMTEPYAIASSASADVEESRLHSVLAAHGAYFLHAMTLGFNVAFARLATDVARRDRWGPLNYAASAVEALTKFDPVKVTLRLQGARRMSASGEVLEAADELVVTRHALQVAAVNLPVFGGAMNLRLPHAQLGDHLLDFVIIEALEPPNLRATVDGLLAGLAHLRESFLNAKGNSAEHGTPSAELTDEAAGFGLPGVVRYQARSAVIETPEHVDVTLDGEIRARTPAMVRQAPEPVRVLLPAEARHTWFPAKRVVRRPAMRSRR